MEKVLKALIALVIFVMFVIMARTIVSFVLRVVFATAASLTFLYVIMCVLMHVLQKET